MSTPATELLAAYRSLCVGLHNLVDSGRLRESDLPDDFQWLTTSLSVISAWDDVFETAHSTPQWISNDAAQERNTILAALRLYQHNGYGDPANQPDWVFDIASNNDRDTTLNDEAIDALCESMNCR